MSKRITLKQAKEMIGEVDCTIVDFAHKADLNEQTLYKGKPEKLLSRKSSRKINETYEELKRHKEAS